tara:strand:- start:4100 stop:5941 length:1842 start_codon:yes stop_codon:yes gene_type:complete
MCGIHGFISQKLSVDSAKSLIKKMVDSTQHRGPDFSDYSSIPPVYFGHNRLSIIDLSEDSNQPMTIGKYTIVYNGEVYNYKEIRANLKQKGVVFSTSSDTEVILQSFIINGEKCVDEFVGMWAFAIFNNNDNSLFCSRDRFGIKPFYYISSGTEFYFASEIKSLKQTPIFTRNLNLDQVSRGLQLGWVVDKTDTYYDCISALEPGTNLFYREGQINKKQYWEVSKKTSLSNPSFDDATERFKEMFNDSMQLHLRSDVPVGATLSGGIDSSSIVCNILKNERSKELNTFSIYYEGEMAVDEREFIKEIESKYKNQFHLFYDSPATSQIEEDFFKISNTMDFPLSGSSPISQYYVMNLVAQKGIKVVLSGQGADDYMGGYMHSYYRYFADKMASFQLQNLYREFKSYKKNYSPSFSKQIDILLKSSLSLFLSEKTLYGLEYRKYHPFLDKKPKERAGVSLSNDSLYRFNSFHRGLINASSLPTLLHYEDRNSMAHSVESRVPFLDHRLVEFLFTLSDNHKIREGFTKRILRDSQKENLPTKIRWRTDKKGFVTPGEVLWLRGSMKHLLEIDYAELSFVDQKKCKSVIDNFKSGSNKQANLVWRLAHLNYWLKNIC